MRERPQQSLEVILFTAAKAGPGIERAVKKYA